MRGVLTVATGLLLLVTTSAKAATASHPFLFGLTGIEFLESREGVDIYREYLEDPCGVAIDSGGDIYVSDYYHDQIVDEPKVLGHPGGFERRFITREEPLDGPCGLALDSSGNLFVNNFHRNVTELGAVIDNAHSTGVAVDPASGDLFVDDRTYIAEYKAPVFAGEISVKIGLGSLGEGYGVAVSDFPATDGYIYVPDASTNTVKVYNPATSLTDPVATVDGQGTPQADFDSLHDSAVAIDQSDGHLYVTDNLQSLDYEHPEAALDEFNAAGEYRGQLRTVEIEGKAKPFIDGEPSAVAVDNSGGPTQGHVFVTSGNSEKGSVYAFGPTAPAHSLEVTESGSGAGTVKSQPAGINCGTACAAEFTEGTEVTLTASPAAGSAFVGWSGGGCTGASACKVTMSEARAVSAEFETAPQQALGDGAEAEVDAPDAPASIASSPARPRSPRAHATLRHHRKHRHLRAERGSH
jgi:DNA-binding beta-propeller fold protein YncE